MNLRKIKVNVPNGWKPVFIEPYTGYEMKNNRMEHTLFVNQRNGNRLNIYSPGSSGGNWEVRIYQKGGFKQLHKKYFRGKNQAEQAAMYAEIYMR